MKDNFIMNVTIVLGDIVNKIWYFDHCKGTDFINLRTRMCRLNYRAVHVTFVFKSVASVTGFSAPSLYIIFHSFFLVLDLSSLGQRVGPL